MKATEQTLQQITRTLRKVAERYPSAEEASKITDIHLRVNQESGELRAYDDDDEELTRCVVEQWIDNKDDTFYDDVTVTLRNLLKKHKHDVEKLSILRPYSFVLEDDDGENIAELYVVDDDLVIISNELMSNLDQDLDDFLDKLLKD